MNITNIRQSLLLPALALISLSAYAIPAKPGLIKAEQPDGTTITITLVGSENNKMAFSEDGYRLITDNEGFYVIADCDDNGFIIPTDIREINISQRSAKTVSRLSKIDSGKTSMASLSQTRTSAPLRGPGLFTRTFPTSGEIHGLVILVEFEDKEFSIENPADFYDRMLNGENFNDYGATGSAREYFIENSKGIFSPVFDVYGPVKLEHNYSYYGRNNAYGAEPFCYKLPIDACMALDYKLDFTKYDFNGDGYIDNVYVFYAGYGEADGGNSNTIWPHSWDIDQAVDEIYRFDDLILNHYACSNELQFPSYGTESVPDGIGTFVHEFSHVLGLPDLYSTYYTTAFTPGQWNVMDVGSYNNESRTPPNFSAFERYALDWLDPIRLTTSGNYEIENLADSNQAYLIPTSQPDEFFLLENRQNKGNDYYLPGHGMLVWHVDYVPSVWDSNTVNSQGNHQYVDLIEADNILTAFTYAGDSFPGTANVTELTCTTTPAFIEWSESPLLVDLYDITETEDGLIQFRAEGCAESGIGNISVRDDLRIDGQTIIAKGNVDVFDLSGRKVATVRSSAITLPSGFYILKTSDKSMKIYI